MTEVLWLAFYVCCTAFFAFLTIHVRGMRLVFMVVAVLFLLFTVSQFARIIRAQGEGSLEAPTIYIYERKGPVVLEQRPRRMSGPFFRKLDC